MHMGIVRRSVNLYIFAVCSTHNYYHKTAAEKRTSTFWKI